MTPEELAERVERLERKVRKLKRRCAKCRGERPTIGFRSELGDAESPEQDPDEDDEIDRTETCVRGRR